VKALDVLGAKPATLHQIAMALSCHVPPWIPLTPLADIRAELAVLVASGDAVRVSASIGESWRLAVAS
jgi:hypothetical protein